MGRAVVVSLGLLIALASSLPSAAQEVLGHLPADPADGVIDGKVAKCFLPMRGEDREAYFDPTGFEAHLVPLDSPEDELVYPAGAWVIPPLDKYEYWLEGPGWISPFRSMFYYLANDARGRTKGRIHAFMTHPAGRVRLADGAVLSGDEKLRLLHLESHNRIHYPQRRFERRVEPQSARRGVQMPAGPVLALVYDRESGEIERLSRPVEVTAGTTAEVAPAPPGDSRSHLFVELRRPGGIEDHEHYDVRLRLTGLTEEPVAPDVVIRTSLRLFAVWYDLAGRSATLEAGSRRVRLAPTSLQLRAGRVESVQLDLQPLPDLHVSFLLPEALQASELHLSVEDPQGEVVVETNLAAETREHVLRDLPAKRLRVWLDAKPWRFLEEVDLSDGLDGLLFFEPEVVTVSGTVFHGDGPHPASVAFKTAGEEGYEARTDTDAEGNYELVLFREDAYLITVALDGREGPPFLELPFDVVRDGDVIDLHVPDNAFRVEVSDAASGRPVEGARVVADNLAEDGKQASQRAVTDDTGVAVLPPLRPGEATIHVQANGYLRAEPRTVQVPAAAGERGLEVELEPEGESRRLRVTLADGSPAAGAELRVQRALAGFQIARWEGKVGADGSVDLPRRFSDLWLLVRHPRAASRVLRLPPPGAHLDAIDLQPAAAPLTVEVLDSDGEPLAWSLLLLDLGDVRLAGGTLAWLTHDGRSATGRDGRWEGTHLPARPLGILAFRVGKPIDAGAYQGAYDALAQQVHPPWPPVVEVPVAD